MIKGAFAEVDPSKFDQLRRLARGSQGARSPTRARPTASRTTPVAVSPPGARTSPEGSASRPLRRPTTSSPPPWTRSRRRRATSSAPGTSRRRDWYAAMSFVYDAGGSIAKKDGDKWKANLSSPESHQGPRPTSRPLLDKYMKGDKTKDESDRHDVYGQGKSAPDLRRGLGGRRRRRPEDRQDRRQAQGQARDLRDARPVRQGPARSSSAVPTSPSRSSPRRRTSPPSGSTPSPAPRARRA